MFVDMQSHDEPQPVLGWYIITPQNWPMEILLHLQRQVEWQLIDFFKHLKLVKYNLFTW